MSTIRAAHYDQTVTQLVADPIVHALARGVAETDRDELAHDEGTPRHEFMGAANREYVARGGEVAGRHIGAVAEAILALLDADQQQHFFEVGGSSAMTDLVAVGWYRPMDLVAGQTLESGRGKFRILSFTEPGAPGAPRLVAVERV